MTSLTGKRNLWFALSAIFILPGLISLIFTGLRLGIDFTGGTQIQLQFERDVDTNAITDRLNAAGYSGVQVQTLTVDEREATQIKLEEIEQISPEKDELYGLLRSEYGEFTELSISTVGAAVSTELQRNSIIAIVVASIFILLYIAWAFRNTRSPFLYGTCAIAAMLHDVLLLVGIFSILGWAADVEVDTLFVTAILTVIGFSVHDTIVVFDRIRENLLKRQTHDFEEIVNYSIAQTLVRSLNTSVTVVFTLLALYLFGGTSTRNFVLALLIGIIAGTYSSIFNAAQLLVAWEHGDIQRLFGRFRGNRGSGSDPAVAPSR